MATAVKDFRNYAFDTTRVKTAGKDVGRKVYPQLYAIENLVRIVIHTVLTKQLGSNWWALTADPNQQKEVAKLMSRYGTQPWHSAPGKHELYYLYLSDLTKILTTHSAQFVPHIPDVAQWTARLELIRVPRNIVGHMNWLTATDRNRIDVCLSDVEQLVAKLAADPLLTLAIP